MDIFSGKGGSAVLLMLPQEFSSRVIDWGEKNVPSDLLSGLPNKGREKGPHITLATGIIDDAPDKAFKLMEKQEPFTVKLGDVDCFRKTDKGYDVIKINVESPELDRLNNFVLENLEINDPILPFKPHITIAYVKPFSCEHLLGNGDFKDMEIPIESYVYSNRDVGGKVSKFKQDEPLKESLDYGFYSMQEVGEYLKKNGCFSGLVSSMDIAKTVILMHSSNKIL